jgi:SAM-dependent methyltransferase
MSDPIVELVRSKYASIAQSSLSGQSEGIRGVAEAFGYSREELAAIPAEANMGLSCGNPTAFASLRSGEVVVDLGCGGGLDVFLAAAKVGPSGKAIGVDMTPEMIARARANAAKGRDGQLISNVEFHLGTIDRLPLPDASADCVISNCVINLAPDKPAVFREIARILKPGGRLAASDLVLKKPLPTDIAQDVMAYVGCIAGAISVEDYRQGLLAAGFAEVDVVDTGADLNAYAQADNASGCCSGPDTSGCCGTPAIVSLQSDLAPTVDERSDSRSPASPDLHGGLRKLLSGWDVNDYAASARIFAVKPH